VDQLYQTPLHWAAKRGYHEMVELLLRHDAKVAAKDVNGQTA
jgi:ankyrin repeat protein